MAQSEAACAGEAAAKLSTATASLVSSFRHRRSTPFGHGRHLAWVHGTTNMSIWIVGREHAAHAVTSLDGIARGRQEHMWKRLNTRFQLHLSTPLIFAITQPVREAKDRRSRIKLQPFNAPMNIRIQSGTKSLEIEPPARYERRALRVATHANR